MRGGSKQAARPGMSPVGRADGRRLRGRGASGVAKIVQGRGSSGRAGRASAPENTIKGRNAGRRPRRRLRSRQGWQAGGKGTCTAKNKSHSLRWKVRAILNESAREGPLKSLAGKCTKGREDASRRDQGRDHAPVAVVVEQREHHLRLPPPPPPPPDRGEVRVVAPRTAALASTESRSMVNSLSQKHAGRRARTRRTSRLPSSAPLRRNFSISVGDCHAGKLA